MPDHDGFRHEAWFYAGEADFVAGTTSFIRQAVAAAEPILVMVRPEKIHGSARPSVPTRRRSPSPTWPWWAATRTGSSLPGGTSWLTMRGGRRLRGIGEPIWAGRTPAELIEAQHHERLLNMVFADASAFWLLCPYDTAALTSEIVAEAQRDHPFVWDNGGLRPNSDYRDEPADGLCSPLPDPPGQPTEVFLTLSRSARFARWWRARRTPPGSAPRIRR